MMWHYIAVVALTCDVIEQFYNEQACCEADNTELLQTCFSYAPSLLALNRHNSLTSRAELMFDTLPTVDQAYHIQVQQSRRYFASSGWSVNAYKAGITSSSDGLALETTQPLYAAYAAEQMVEYDLPVSVSSCRGALDVACGLELEFGYALNMTTIPSEFTLETISRYIVSVSPVFEVVQFLCGSNFTALDLILTNVASWRYLRGSSVPWTPALQSRIDHFATSLIRDGTVVTGAHVSNLDILRPVSPLTILVATLNHIIAVDKTALQENMFILTGNMLDENVVLRAGEAFTADYSSVGMDVLKIRTM